jgi:hypothetical protein
MNVHSDKYAEPQGGVKGVAECDLRLGYASATAHGLSL